MKKGASKFIMYMLRWQASTPILALCLWLLEPLGNVWATVIANIVGGALFFFIDRWIFGGGKK